jgi:hypothetical protein
VFLETGSQIANAVLLVGMAYGFGFGFKKPTMMFGAGGPPPPPSRVFDASFDASFA